MANVDNCSEKCTPPTPPPSTVSDDDEVTGPVGDTQTWEKAYEAAKPKPKKASSYFTDSPQSPTGPPCDPEGVAIPLEGATVVDRHQLKYPLTSTLYQKDKKPLLQMLYLRKVYTFCTFANSVYVLLKIRLFYCYVMQKQLLIFREMVRG